MILPETLKGFNLFVEGSGYGGRVLKFTPPKLTRKTEEFRPGGFDAAVEIDVGQEKMTIEEIILAEPSVDILRQYGRLNLDGLSIRLKGSYQAENSDLEKPLEIVMRGKWTEIDFGSFEPEKPGEMKLKGSISYFKWTYNNSTLIEIDAFNAVNIVDGQDRLAQRRANLGI